MPSPFDVLAQQNQSIQDPVARRKADQYINKYQPTNLASVKSPYSMSVKKDPTYAGIDYTKLMNPSWAKWFDTVADVQAQAQNPVDAYNTNQQDRQQVMPNQQNLPAQREQEFARRQQQQQDIEGQRRYETSVGNIAYGRETASPAYQMGQYQVGQARRTPQQKGTDVGTALRALQESSGLPLLGSGSSTGFGVGGAGGTGVPRVNAPDNAAAQAAVFARAKDQAGATARAALTGLQGEMAGRGLLGSGIEAAGTGEVIGRAGQGVNEVTREQAIQQAINQAQMTQLGYQGDITQRGQDIQSQLADRARQQQMIQGLLSVFSPGLY